MSRHGELHGAPGGSTVRARSSAPAWSLLGLSFAALAGFVALGPEDGAAIFGLVALATITALVVGPRRNRPARRWPWHCFAAASTLFLVGAVLRGVLTGPAGLTSLWPDAFSLPGYALLAAGMVGLLSARQAGQDNGARTDAVVVGVAAVLLAWAFLTVPTLATDAPSIALRVVSGVYPPIDAMLLLLVVHLALTDVSRAPAYWLLLACMGALFIGDMGYNLSLADIANVPPALLDAPYLLGYGAIGAAALHPSMGVLTTPQPTRVRPLVRGRLLTVTLAAVAPVLIIIAAPPATLRDRIVLAVGVAVLVGAVFQRTVRAVNQHARSESVLAEQASRDALTGLPNRAQLAEWTQAELGRAAAADQSVAVLFLDLDRFKVVNDSWGHTAGDELLVAVGDRLRSRMRDDDCVARAGGDEFAVVCRVGVGEQSLLDGIAARVLATFANTFALSVGELVVTPSIGVAVAEPGSGHTAERLVRDAEIAMYRAKEAGRNRWTLFDESMHEAVAGRLGTEQLLRRALDGGGLSVHYQPIVALATDRITGFEALARLEIDGERIPPDVFIPVAEDSGLILPVGRWVLAEALRQLGQWHRQGGEHLYMSVNLSARQLRDTALIPLVKSALAADGIPAESLRLEITESVLMDDADAALTVLEQLRALGVHLSVDDFGTGYSSLGYLKRFPVSTVKIDRSFVSGLADNTDDQEIVRAVIAMAGALSLAVVAEGVETAAHRDCLRALGCESAQGWLYGKPLPAAAATAAYLADTQPVAGKLTA